jgi:hypothetical protein
MKADHLAGPCAGRPVDLRALRDAPLRLAQPSA